jgi:hypothetical protein
MKQHKSETPQVALLCLKKGPHYLNLEARTPSQTCCLQIYKDSKHCGGGWEQATKC